MGRPRSRPLGMQYVARKSWLGTIGLVVVLAGIVLLFTFVIPLESYTGNPPANALCNGVIGIFDHLDKTKFHLLKGEAAAYQEAKARIASDPTGYSCGNSSTVQLYL